MRRITGRKIALLSGCAVAVALAAAGVFYRDDLAAWYRFHQEFESLGDNPQGYPEFRHVQTGMVFVKVPGGKYAMGSPDAEKDRQQHEGPVHDVTLSPFLISKYEVTQAQWKIVMGNNPSSSKRDNLPVESVSWEDCQEFCSRIGLSLPSEAQWEYACRAGSTGAYAGTGKLDELGWHGGNSGSRTHPVGEKRPNDFGLYDMHGNVCEWCEDVYDARFYETARARENPVCASGSELRVMRGGGWFYPGELCRSAYRFGDRPSRRDFVVGLRPTRRAP